MRLFQKEGILFVLRVFSSTKRQVCFCFHVLQERVLRRIKPQTTPLVFGTLADMTRGKAELLAENARYATPTDHSPTTKQTAGLSQDGPAFPSAASQDGSDLETGTLSCPAGDGSREGRVSFSICSGSANRKPTRESRGSRLRRFS